MPSAGSGAGSRMGDESTQVGSRKEGARCQVGGRTEVALSWSGVHPVLGSKGTDQDLSKSQGGWKEETMGRISPAAKLEERVLAEGTV